MTSNTTCPRFACALLSLGLTACAADDSGAPEPPDTLSETQRLATYRAALPSSAQFMATTPEASQSFAVGDPAMYPEASRNIVQGINGTITGAGTLLDLLKETPPTVYNSETSEFFWGPYAEDVGFVGAYLRDAGAEADFRYEFAFVRSASRDVQDFSAVLAGGVSPAPDDENQGRGLLLWDFSAAKAFYRANDPDFDPAEHPEGRFAVVFGAGPAEDDPDAELTVIVAAFRGFVDEDSDEAPVDLDYLYGRYEGADHQLDFIDFETQLDVDSDEAGVREQLGVRMAFLDEGLGRAEVDGSDGSLEANQRVEVTECWDASLSQSYISARIVADGDSSEVLSDGQESSCGLFESTLAELEVPALEDLDPELLAALDRAASEGL